MRFISSCLGRAAAPRRLGHVATLLLLAALAAVSRAQGNPRFVALADGDMLRITLPEAPPRGLVLLLPDALGGDPRSAPYVETLLAARFAAAEPQWQRLPPAEQPDRALRVMALVPALASQLGLTTDAIGLVGFGLGARAALQAAMQRGWPAALLYPDCAGLISDPPPPAEAAEQGLRVALTTAPAPPRLLLLHGSADAAEPEGACAALSARLGPLAARHVYFGATYGWDYAPGPWENMASLLPAPDGRGGLRRANMSTGVTADAASRVADFMARHVAAPGWGRR